MERRAACDGKDEPDLVSYRRGRGGVMEEMVPQVEGDGAAGRERWLRRRCDGTTTGRPGDVRWRDGETEKPREPLDAWLKDMPAVA
ncbi:hypothetical protein U1Q18_018689 [Sarracenia purpurea var. burkii]